MLCPNPLSLLTSLLKQVGFILPCFLSIFPFYPLASLIPPSISFNLSWSEIWAPTVLCYVLRLWSHLVVHTFTISANLKSSPRCEKTTGMASFPQHASHCSLWSNVLSCSVPGRAKEFHTTCLCRFVCSVCCL